MKSTAFAGQYHPAGKVTAERYPEINRRPTFSELDRAKKIARELGLHRLDERSPQTHELRDRQQLHLEDQRGVGTDDRPATPLTICQI